MPQPLEKWLLTDSVPYHGLRIVLKEKALVPYCADLLAIFNSVWVEMLAAVDLEGGEDGHGGCTCTLYSSFA